MLCQQCLNMCPLNIRLFLTIVSIEQMFCFVNISFEHLFVSLIVNEILKHPNYASKKILLRANFKWRNIYLGDCETKFFDNVRCSI